MSTMSEILAEQKKTVGSDELAAGGLTTSSRIWTSMTGFSVSSTSAPVSPMSRFWTNSAAYSSAKVRKISSESAFLRVLLPFGKNSRQ